VQLPSVLQESNLQGILLVSFFQRHNLLKKYNNNPKKLSGRTFLQSRSGRAWRQLELQQKRATPDTGKSGSPAHKAAKPPSTWAGECERDSGRAAAGYPALPVRALTFEVFQKTSTDKCAWLPYKGIEARPSYSLP